MKALFVLAMIALTTFAYSQPQDSLHVLWDRSGLQDSSAYGTQILPLGDQNNDGYADWAVMAWGNLGHHGTQPGYLEFFHGGNPLPTQPYHIYQVDPARYHQPEARAVGDFNGDGYADWVLWRSRADSSGIVETCLYLGGSFVSDTPAVIFRYPGVVMSYALGDFNGDGKADLLFYRESTNEAWICYGGSPMDTVVDWALTQLPPGMNHMSPYAVGDFNGDGASDFVCFNPNNYHVAIFLGGSQPDTVPAYQWDFTNRVPIGGVNSLNGDGAEDLISVSEGGIDVNFGRATLLSPADNTVQFSCAGGPHYAVSAGDVNHDGYGDMLVYVPTCTGNMFGSLSLYSGHPWINTAPALVIDGDSPPLNLIGIYAAAALGDVNGDSVDDIAVGAYDDFAYLGWRGRCVILAGDSSMRVAADNPRSSLPKDLSVAAYPNPFNGETTIRVQAPSSNEPVTLTTYNTLGQAVHKAVLPAFSGEYLYRYNAPGLPSGLYFLTVQAGPLSTTQKLMLLR